MPDRRKDEVSFQDEIAAMREGDRERVRRLLRDPRKGEPRAVRRVEIDVDGASEDDDTAAVKPPVPRPPTRPGL